MWKPDYEMEYLIGNDHRGCVTSFKHTLGFVASHDTASQTLIIQDNGRTVIAHDFRLMDVQDALTILNRDYS